jgi:hypothetical protein
LLLKGNMHETLAWHLVPSPAGIIEFLPPGAHAWILHARCTAPQVLTMVIHRHLRPSSELHSQSGTCWKMTRPLTAACVSHVGLDHTLLMAVAQGSIAQPLLAAPAA